MIHLFFRRRPKKVEFSDLRFIKLAAEKVRTRVKLRRYALLVVRTLIILLLVMSFAKPYFHTIRSAGGAGGDDQLSAVILIDVSYSCGYYDGSGQRVAAFRDAAKKILSLLPPKSRAGIIAYSQKVESATPALSGDRKYLSNIVDVIRPSYGTTDISCALGPARNMMDTAGSRKRVLIILSDMAAHGFGKKADLAQGAMRVIYFEPAGGENAWIKNAALDYDANSGGFVINAEAGAVGKTRPETLPVSYFAGGRKIGADFMKMERDGRYRSGFFAGAIEPDSLSGRAQLAVDRLEADNVFYFAGKRPADFKVWIIDGDPKFGGVSSESFYLKKAFPRAEVLSESAIDTARFTAPGAVVLANVTNDNPKIAEFLKSGGGVLVFLGSHSSENFQPAYLPADIGSKFSGAESVSWTDAGRQFRDSADAGPAEWEKTSVDQGFVLMPKENAAVLANLDSGRAFIVEGGYGGSRVVVCASTAGREWNNMPARPYYAPLLSGLLRYVSGAETKEEKTSCLVGETYRRKAPRTARIVTPNGERLKPAYAGADIYFSETWVPGIYKVMDGERELSSFAVNVDAGSGESDLTPVSNSALKEYFKGCALLEMPKENWERYFLSLISGRDVTRIMLAVVFLLLVLEVLLANPKRQH